MFVSLPATELRTTFNCNHILACFLIQTTQMVSHEFYRELVVFVCFFRMALHEIGMHTKKEHFPECKDNLKDDFCKTNDLTVVPKIANEFLANLFERYYKDLKIEEGQ